MKRTGLFLALSQAMCGTALSANIEVTTTDSSPGCSLADAIASANFDNSTGDCAMGSGADTITFSPALSLPATASLTAGFRIDSQITINGPGQDMLTVDFENTGSISIYDYAVALRDLTFVDSANPFFISGSPGVMMENVEIRGAANRAFRIETSTVSISNSTIRENQGDYGGAFRIDPGASVTITGSQVTANTATAGGGGAIFSSGGLLSVSNTTFADNTAAFNGGAININSGSLAVTGSTFTGNSAAAGSGRGGAIYAVSNTVTLLESHLEYNNGGAIRSVTGEVNATDSTFSGNINAGGPGGAVHVRDGTLRANTATFTNNSASGDGGAVYFRGQDASAVAEIGDSGFYGNTADGSGGGMAMRMAGGMLTVDSTVFTGNSAVSRGGAAFADTATASFTNATVTSNTADSGGGLMTYQSLTTLGDSTINQNTASFGGGANFANGTVYVSGSSLASNSARSGGGLSLFGTATISNVTISLNQATVSGGGIQAASSDVEISDSLIQFNNAAGPYGLAIIRGGGLHASNSTISLTGSTLQENQSVNDGGGAYFRDTTASLSAVTLAGNTVTDTMASYGGAIRGEQSDLTFSGITVTGNNATAIHTRSGPVGVTGSVFSGNTSDSLGGALRVQNGNLDVDQSTFSMNTATAGGAIRFNGISENLTIQNSSFYGNSAESGDGGAIDSRITMDGFATISGVSAYYNSASIGGGGIRLFGAIANVSNLTVIGNTASEKGGGIEVRESNAVVSGLTAYDNSALGGGGLSADLSSIDILGASIQRNASTYEGGGIRVGEGETTVQNTLLSANTAGSAGGGIAVFFGQTLDLSQTAIFNNRAGIEGGGLASYLTSVSVAASTISQNEAPASAGLSASGANISVTDSTLVNDHGTDSDVAGLGLESLVATLSNSIVVGGASDCYVAADAEVVLVGENHFSDASCGGMAAGDPLVTGVADNGGPTPSQYPRQGSPVIDTGAAGCDGQEDQRGVVRVAPCDIGSVESVGTNDPPVLVARDFTVFGQLTNGQLIGVFEFFDPDGVLPMGAARILGPDVPFALSDDGSLTIDDVAPEYGIYEFSIEVTDAEGLSDRAQVRIALDAVLLATGFEE